MPRRRDDDDSGEYEKPRKGSNATLWVVLAAVGGGVGGAMSERPNSTYRQFVQRCASEKGLDIIGWN